MRASPEHKGMCDPASANAMAPSDWSSLEAQTLDQVIHLLSKEAVVSNSVLPEDKTLCSIQIDCRHWRSQARKPTNIVCAGLLRLTPHILSSLLQAIC